MLRVFLPVGSVAEQRPRADGDTPAPVSENAG